MTASVVQSKWAQVVPGTTLSVTLDTTPVEGNLLLAVVTTNSTMGTITAAPWGLPGPDVIGGSTPTVHIYSKVAGHTEPTTVTFTSSTSKSFSLAVIEVTPTAGKVWLGMDVSAVNTNASASSLALGPTGTQFDTDDFAIAGIGLSGSSGTAPTWSSTLTTIGTLPVDTRGFAGYKTLTSTAAASATGSWTTARVVAGAIATYKQSAPLPSTGFVGLL